MTNSGLRVTTREREGVHSCCRHAAIYSACVQGFLFCLCADCRVKWVTVTGGL